MFICSSCNKVSESGEKPDKKVLQTRPKTYTTVMKDSRGKIKYDKQRNPIEKVSEGFETVRESNVCGKCI